MKTTESQQTGVSATAQPAQAGHPTGTLWFTPNLHSNYFAYCEIVTIYCVSRQAHISVGIWSESEGFANGTNMVEVRLHL